MQLTSFDLHASVLGLLSRLVDNSAPARDALTASPAALRTLWATGTPNLNCLEADEGQGQGRSNAHTSLCHVLFTALALAE